MTRLFLTLLSVLVLSGMGFSQSANIDAKANLVGTFTVSGDVALDFGDITDFDTPTTVDTYDGGGTSGKFTVGSTIGNPNISLQFDLPDNLTLEDDVDDVDGFETEIPINEFKYRLVGEGGQGDGNEKNMPGGGKITDINLAAIGGLDRELEVFIGATIEPDNDNIAGSYKDIITVTVEYN